VAVFLPVAILYQRAVNLKFNIFNASGRAVSPLTAGGAHGVTRPTDSIVNRKSQIVNGFTLVEILVVVVLMSLIVLALMAVFNSTQAAFRASITQTDVLEGGRSVMGLLKSDLELMTPSFGQSNLLAGAVNFYANTNQYQYQAQSAPLVQSLAGSSGNQRTNVLEKFFILTRQNTMWTGVGYMVNTASTNYLNPLYRFSISTNVMAANPAVLYTNFLKASFTNMSHLMDGVVHLTVRAYDLNGVWLTNGYINPLSVTVKNVRFLPTTLGETGFYMFSNALPASVEIQLGILEDRTLQRAQSISGLTQSNYLAGRAGQVHLFRQRFPIRNVDPAAYQ
jgi:prepilin-type N-terminal cleavage/methylation domain-containing protein